MKNLFNCIIFSIVIISIHPLCGRSIHRKKDPNKPEITIGWKHSPTEIKHSHWSYRKYPLFEIFNKDFFESHLLPGFITLSFDNEREDLINTRTINNLIEKLILEIKRHKKLYSDFIVLQDKNFNYKKKCGLLVLKFKKFPLVLKLVMETPKTFIDPYCKGFENQFFFYMSGGNNRHIAGLTRIKNLELVKQQIHNHPRWKHCVTTPRKWYWLAKKPRWIAIKGRNIGEEKQIETEIPGTYAIIADELDIKEELNTLTYQNKSELIMELCMDLHLFVDPHADNFVIKYQEKSGEYTISIIDTEHFPSMVGLKEEPIFNNHLEWYLYLGAKFFQDAFLQTKQSHTKAQHATNPYEIKW
jgi:hypothetical protein